MALIMRGKNGEFLQKCPLCGNTLSMPLFATSHFIADPNDELYRFSDATMHWECYQRWPLQKRFASLYFEAELMRAEPGSWSPYWGVLLRVEDMLVTYGFVVQEVSIVLRESGTDIRVARADWSDWLAGKWRDRKKNPGFGAIDLPPKYLTIALQR